MKMSDDKWDEQKTCVQGGSCKKKKLSTPGMPLAISSQRVNTWYHTDPHDQWKRVTWPEKKITASGSLYKNKAHIDQ